MATPMAFADEQGVTYSQADGYEPYQGWQESPWDEASDPWHNSSGGANLTYTLDPNTPSGFIITTSPDPADWNASGDPMNWVASDKVVWEATTSNTVAQSTSDNWCKNIVCTVDASALEAEQTYYLVIKNGTAGQWARIYADIVFELSTDVDRVATWEGDLSKAGYGNEQGNGGTKLGIFSPAQFDLTVDLTQIATCWDNNVTDPMALDSNNAVSFVVHADGSGSSWQLIDGWSANDQIKVYDQNPIGENGYDVSGIEPMTVCPNGITCMLVNEERDWPSLDGVNVTPSSLPSVPEPTPESDGESLPESDLQARTDSADVAA